MTSYITIFIGIIALCTPVTLSASTILEEVLVTARKKLERRQDIPLSMQSLSAEMLDIANINNLTQMNNQLINTSVAGTGGLGSSNAAFYIRAMGTSRNAVNQEPAVALYIDDEYYGRSDGALLNVLDIERIEVLRGPQGTLFGRNATAGAIRYITRAPSTDALLGEVQISVGEDTRKDFKATLNAPLSPNAAVRVNATSLNQHGQVKNEDTRNIFGGKKFNALRVKSLWNISDDVSVHLGADYSENHTGGGASVLVYVNPTAPFVLAEAAAGYDISALPLGDAKRSFQTADNFNRTRNRAAALTLNWRISNNITFKTVSTSRAVNTNGAYDTDGSPAVLFEQIYLRSIQAHSQEFTLTGDSKKWDWQTGLYYYDETASDHRLVAMTTNGPTNRSSTRIVNPITIESYAAFAQGTYFLVPQWSINIGARYTHDTKHITANELNAAGTPKVEDVSRSKSWAASSGRLGVQWQFQPRTLLYVSGAKGFRAGGFNDRIRTDLPDNYFGITDFDEETTNTLELGANHELPRHNVRINGAIFSNRYNDMQLGSILPGTARTVIQNAGEAKIQGAEVELLAFFANAFRVQIAAGYIDARYTQLSEEVTAVTLGSAMPRAPRWSVFTSLQWSKGPWLAYIDYGWKHKHRTVVADNDYLHQGAYGLVNANVSYQAHSQWQWSLYSNNLLDKHYWVSGLNLDSGKPMGIIQGEPGHFREVGVKVKFLF